MPTPDLEPVTCPACGANGADLLYRVRDHLFAAPGDFQFVCCRSCRLVYLNPRPTLEGLRRFYPSEYFCYGPVLQGDAERQMGGLTRRLARQRIRALEREVGPLPREAHVLDVGCGANAFLYHLNRLRGCEALGVDFNAAVVEAIQRNLNMPARCGSLLSLDLPPEDFDGVAMYEYLEHEGRPRDVLAAARRLTRPGGWLVIETPNIVSGLAKIFGRKWCQLDAPRHLVLYEPATITRMLESCGYEVIAIRPLTYQFMLGFSLLVALGFRRLGRLRPWEMALGIAATLPFIYLPRIFPEFMRVYARRT